jgi:hypothetical protein
MRYDLNDPRQYIEATNHLQEAASCHWVIEIKRWFKPKSNKQNNYLHFLCRYFATEYGCTTADAKEVYLKRQACPHIFAETITNKHGEIITRYKSTAELNIAETSAAIRNFIDWAAAGGYELPMPDDQAFIRHAEYEIDKHQHLI